MKGKYIFLIGLFVILTGMLVLVGCSPRQGQVSADEEVALGEGLEEPSVDEQVTEEPVVDDPDTPVSSESEVEEAVEEPEAEPEVALSGTLVGGVREVSVVASRFDFGPETITVRQGEEVRLLLTTDDVAHGIGLREFGINANIPTGETTVVTFVADTAGEFTFFCSVPCGAGHGSMTGKLVVI